MDKLPGKAIVLARGLGSRMRAASPGTILTAEQARVADAGAKSLIPIAGSKTLLDLILANLTDAAFTDICLVIGPEHDAIRDHCSNKHLDVRFAVQNEAKGSADAVSAAEAFVGDAEFFLVVNSDNLYPARCLSLLHAAGRPAMLAFERESLIGRSNIPEERVAKFATVQIDEHGNLRAIVEKPEHIEPNAYISMNAWLFSNSIFEACRAIEPSERGEYELTTAVQYSIDNLGEQIAAIKTQEGVLDLSSRSDIQTAGRFLGQS
ncbi:MAG: nucleotidyltransferase family protein [Acidobacteriota bacterium]